MGACAIFIGTTGDNRMCARYMLLHIYTAACEYYALMYELCCTRPVEAQTSSMVLLRDECAYRNLFIALVINCFEKIYNRTKTREEEAHRRHNRQHTLPLSKNGRDADR